MTGWWSESEIWIENSDNKATSGFRFKPGALRRHNQALISNVDKFLYTDRVKREGTNAVFVAPVNQFLDAPDAADEVNVVWGPQVRDT